MKLGKETRNPVQRGKIIFPPIFYMISKHGTAQTLNQRLKRTICKKTRLATMGLPFYANPLDGWKENLLVAFG
jgi:hypothetical protein